MTLSGSQAGNTCPFQPDPHFVCVPGAGFPFLLTSMGTPLYTYNLRSGTLGSTKNGESPVYMQLDLKKRENRILYFSIRNQKGIGVI